MIRIIGGFSSGAVWQSTPLITCPDMNCSRCGQSPNSSSATYTLVEPWATTISPSDSADRTSGIAATPLAINRFDSDGVNASAARIVFPFGILFPSRIFSVHSGGRLFERPLNSRSVMGGLKAHVLRDGYCKPAFFGWAHQRNIIDDVLSWRIQSLARVASLDRVEAVASAERTRRAADSPDRQIPRHRHSE